MATQTGSYDFKAARAVQTNLDNLEIGGRNYILNSAGVLANNRGSAAGSRKEYIALNLGQSYMEIPHGTQVTVSFDLVMDVATANPTLLVYNTNNKGPKAFSQSASGDGTITGVTLHFTAAVGDTIARRCSVTGYINDRTSPTATDNWLEFYSNYGSSNFFSIANLKLEVGNKATDWTPAPEDMALATDSVEYIVGTQTGKTGSWTGVTKDSILYSGKTIAYKLPYAGNGNASLQLKDSAGNNVGGNIAVYLNTTRVTTHFGAGAVINMTYDGTYWRTSSIPNSNNYDRRLHNQYVKAAANLAKYSICAGTESGYKTLAAGVAFDISYPILYLNADNASGQSYAVASGGQTAAMYEAIPSVNPANTLAVANIPGIAANKIMYVKGTVSGNTFTCASSGFLTCNVSSSDDGIAYIPIGKLGNDYTSSATSKLFFTTSKDLYCYKDGAFGPASIREAAEAAKVAGNYIWESALNDMWLHSEGYGPDTDPNSQTYGQPIVGENGTYGWRIGSVFELIRAGLSYFKLWVDSNLVARVRVGLDTAGHSIFSPSGMEIYNASNKVAEFGASGVTLGKDDELQLKLTSSSFALENDVDENVFSLTEDTLVKSFTSNDVTTFSGTADTTARTVSDTAAVLHDTGYEAASAWFKTGGKNWPLSSSQCTVTVTVGTGVTVQLTSTGKTYVEGKMSDADGQGTLVVYYWVAHYEKVELEMRGTVSVSGHGNMIELNNDADSPLDGDFSAFVSVNPSPILQATRKPVRFGYGEGGNNRGIWDDTAWHWMVRTDADGVTTLGGLSVKTADVSSAVSVSSSSYKSIASLSLEAGIWLVFYGAQFNTSNSGVRSMWIGTTQNAAGSDAQYRESLVQVVPCSGYETYMRGACILSPSATTTYYLSLWQNSGSARSCKGNVKALRIG